MQKTVAVGGVLTTVATGVVTNQITDQWSWTWAAALAVLVAAGAWLAVLTLGGSSSTGRTRHHIRADHNGRIEASGATGRDGAVIEQTATRGGTITGSPVSARNADVEQTTDHGGQITDSPSDIR
ncbi:hypothetical protein F9278_15285 [Streptomyces phaeolivaceus]|uniref:Uncharacterized protein n=1 Tax=Streptomyces phaeolivaceus TaxID=2653200 RepID=A0A5P8K261_9ACTN|nr:hypothetical protein [Streptomyces phaeolivaceus]QFQ97343.1 hypothetical protein F9278_15285 [Streptomyces phaeolivaceus]